MCKRVRARCGGKAGQSEREEKKKEKKTVHFFVNLRSIVSDLSVRTKSKGSERRLRAEAEGRKANDSSCAPRLGGGGVSHNITFVSGLTKIPQYNLFIQR